MEQYRAEVELKKFMEVASTEGEKIGFLLGFYWRDNRLYIKIVDERINVDDLLNYILEDYAHAYGEWPHVRLSRDISIELRVPREEAFREENVLKFAYIKKYLKKKISVFLYPADRIHGANRYGLIVKKSYLVKL